MTPRPAEPPRDAGALFPHPYLGWVHHGNAPGGLPNVNAEGLFGREFPHRKDEARFTILLTGGALASALGGDLPNGPRWLEDELNRRFTPGGGRPFVVLNGGLAGWKQPQQAILFLLHAHAVDAVVTLDGWNEFCAIGGRHRLELPASSFGLANPIATRSHRQLVGTWLAGDLVRWGRTHPLPRRLRILQRIADAIARAIERRLVESRPESTRAGDSGDPGTTKRTTMESLFALPSDWDADRSRRHGVRSVEKYLRAMNAVARRWHARTAHLLAPVPVLEKPLTDAEREVAGDLSAGERYAGMVAELSALRERGLPVVSLTDAFRDRPERVWADGSRLVRDPETGASPASAHLAARVADALAALWGLERHTDAVVLAAAAPPRPMVVCHVGPRTSLVPGYDADLTAALAGTADRAGIAVQARDGGAVGSDVALVHCFNLSGYRIVHANAEQADAAGVPWVLSPFWADWPAFRLAAEERFQRQRAALGLATGDLAAAAAAFATDDAARMAAAGALVARAARVVAASVEEAARLRRDFPGARVAVVPPGVVRLPAGDVDAFVAKYGTRDFVLCVGELQPRQNQLTLLEALADDDVDVVLATGGWTSRPDYLEACRAFRRRGRTLYLPQLDVAELAAAYAAARVHVVPSWFSVQGRATIEALQAGCAVVASDRGALPELLGDTVPFAPPDDPAALRRAIASAAGTSFAAARARAEHLTLERAAASVLTLYGEVLSEVPAGLRFGAIPAGSYRPAPAERGVAGR
jgi:hypothetical protein